MEELPEILPDLPDISDSTEPVPDYTADAPPSEPKRPIKEALPKQVLAYELDISPNARAKVEIEDMAEADFDRHEVLSEETAQNEPAVSGMIPLSQVLERHPVMQNSVVSGGNVDKAPIRKFLARPRYHQALLQGIGMGLIVSIIMAVALIIVNR